MKKQLFSSLYLCFFLCCVCVFLLRCDFDTNQPQGACVAYSGDICQSPNYEQECHELAKPEYKPTTWYREKSCEDIGVPRVSYEEFFGRSRPTAADLERLCEFYGGWITRPGGPPIGPIISVPGQGENIKINIAIWIEWLCDDEDWARHDSLSPVDQYVFQTLTGQMLKEESRDYLKTPIKGVMTGARVEFNASVDGDGFTGHLLGWLDIETVGQSERYAGVSEIEVTGGDFSGLVSVAYGLITAPVTLEFDQSYHNDQTSGYQHGFLLSSGDGYIEVPVILTVGTTESHNLVDLYVHQDDDGSFAIEDVLAIGFRAETDFRVEAEEE